MKTETKKEDDESGKQKMVREQRWLDGPKKPKERGGSKASINKNISSTRHVDTQPKKQGEEDKVQRQAPTLTTTTITKPALDRGPKQREGR